MPIKTISVALLALTTATASQAADLTYFTTQAVLDAHGPVINQCAAEIGHNIENVVLPGVSMQQKLMAELTSGSGAFDVVQVNDSNFTTSVARFMEPLRPYMEKKPLSDGGLEDFVPAFVQQFSIPQTSEGEIYAVPNRMDVDILFYRKDYFEKYGITAPKTPDEYLDAARKLKEALRADGDNDTWPAVMQGATLQIVLDWYDWVSGQGGNMFTAPNWDASELLSPEVIAATRMRQQFVEEGLASPSTTSFSNDDVINSMAQGNAAMTIMYGPYWRRLQDPTRSSVVDKIGYGHAPRLPDVEQAHFSRGWAVGIPKNSENKDAAWELINCMTSFEHHKETVINHGNAAVRISVVNDPDYEALVPVADAVQEALPRAKIMPNIPGLPQIYEIIAGNLQRTLNGELSAEEAMQAAHDEVSPMLKR